VILFFDFAQLSLSHLDRVHEVKYFLDILFFSPEVQLQLSTLRVVHDVQLKLPLMDGRVSFLDILDSDKSIQLQAFALRSKLDKSLFGKGEYSM
jgi:hypothetical protein